jgi:hypothetical protein
MGVALEAIVKLYLFEYRLKFSLDFFLIAVLVIFLSGVRPALPMGVALKAIMGCLQSIIGSKLNFFNLCSLYFPVLTFYDIIADNILYLTC